jgi:penicillin amidase
MVRFLKNLLKLLLALMLLVVLGLAWWVYSKQPQRSGQVLMAGLSAPVAVRYDELGVPHLDAQNEADLYRALGYVHAQDRLFQMEMLRRLARGELAEVLGPKLVETDRLFRTLGIRVHADAYAARWIKDKSGTPAMQSMQAYLDGINQYQDSRPAPLEFQLLGIPKRPFTLADSISVAGYLAYSFAAAFRTEPVLTQIRDKLGAGHLKAFDLDWKPDGALRQPLQSADWQDLTRLARISAEALQAAGLPQFEGSNAWVIAGARTASGKPLLAGDPHIAFSAPSVWYEAHLKAPGFELYGHLQALNPSALLGHNPQFGWSLTMFQNDDLDLIVEKTNPANPQQVMLHGQWVDLQSREETLNVKGAAPVRLTLRRSPHGPIVNDALDASAGSAPVAMWWAFLETENPLIEAFYELNRADTLGKARAAAAKIHSPGLNVVWANAAGDIAWWAAASLPIRPDGMNPSFLLDGSSGEADKLGFQPFSANPQEENPARGYIVSANHQPASSTPIPGYYNLWDRAERLDQRLRSPSTPWTVATSQALQLDVQTGYGPRVLAPILPLLKSVVSEPAEKELLEQLASWNGGFEASGVAPTLFSQLLYEIAREAMVDELGDVVFNNLRRTRALDHALPRLMADPGSPWWDKRGTPAVETQSDVLKAAWAATLVHLRKTLGSDPAGWQWSKAHTLTHVHPLGRQEPLDRIFNVGPFAMPGARETPNNQASLIGPAPWAVVYGPSTRRLIDFADAGQSLGINPVGQSGVWPDRHYADQAKDYAKGLYRPQHLGERDVASHAKSTLMLRPQ